VGASEGREEGVGAGARNDRGGGGRDLGVHRGRRSCERIVGRDRSKRQGPRTSESGRANGRPTLMRGARGTERRRGARARRVGADRSAPPDRGREREGERADVGWR
jgi:hypothetical protein